MELLLCGPVLLGGVPAFGALAGGIAGVHGHHFPPGTLSLCVQDREEHPPPGIVDRLRPITLGPTVVNGNPALLVHLDGEVDGIMAIRVEDARITGLYYVRNPEKLTRVESETPLTLR